MRDEPPAFELHPERAEALLGEDAACFGQRHRLRLGVPTLREIPEPLPATPAGDGDQAAPVQELQHPRQLGARAPPDVALVGSGRRVLEVARQQRPAPFELAEDVPPESSLLLQELARPALPLVAAPRLAHPRADEWQVFERPDERVPLEEFPLFPQKAIELRLVERAEPAPEDELLRRRDSRDRIDLEEAEPADRLENVARRPVEELRANREPSRLLRRN